MFNEGDIVKIVDTNKIESDETLEKEALQIIKESNYTGEVTKVENGIHFVGFMNDLGWVTQGFKADEIQEVK